MSKFDIWEDSNHEHCYHAFTGPIWMVVPPGHVVQKCCKCESVRTIHVDHTRPMGWNFGKWRRQRPYEMGNLE
jgi:hypothetical protein